MTREDLSKRSDEQIVKMTSESNVHDAFEAGAISRAAAVVEMMRRNKDQMKSLAAKSTTLTKTIFWVGNGGRASEVNAGDTVVTGVINGAGAGGARSDTMAC